MRAECAANVPLRAVVKGHVRVVEELVDAGANTKVWCSLELVQQVGTLARTRLSCGAPLVGLPAAMG